MGAFLQQQGQFLVGKYLGLLGSEVKTTRFFQYEEIGDLQKRYNHIIENLITAEESIVIRTNTYVKWENQGKIQLQDGRFYLINNILEQKNEINSQAMAFVKENPNTFYYLELIGVEEDE